METKKTRSDAQKKADKKYEETVAKKRYVLFQARLLRPEHSEIKQALEEQSISNADFVRRAAKLLMEKKL